MRAPHNDRPISQPSEDRFGIDPFAKALAASIAKMPSPELTEIRIAVAREGDGARMRLIERHRLGAPDRGGAVGAFDGLAGRKPTFDGHEMVDDAIEPARTPRRRRQHPFQKALGEDLPPAKNGVAAKAASDYYELDHPARQWKVPDPASVAAMNAARGGAARWTMTNTL